MEVRGSGLFRTFMHTLETTQPPFFRLTEDRFWVAEPEPRDDGGTALVLQSFDNDGNEVLHRELYRVGPEESAPYYRLTQWAVILLHAPEDTLDAEEDKALTLRWFPYDTLTEQVWRIEPSQLPGELSGIIQIWDEPDRTLLTLQGTFLREDEVINTYIKLDLESRRLTPLWSAAPGIHEGEPDLPRPFDGPNEETLVVDLGLIDLITKSFSLPDGTSIHPTDIKADNVRCRIDYKFFPPTPAHIALIQKLSHKLGYDPLKNFSSEKQLKVMKRLAKEVGEGSVSGPHYSFFFPAVIEDRPVIFDLKSGVCYPCFNHGLDDFPQKIRKGNPFLRLSKSGVLEADRAFADAHLSQLCRNMAEYVDESCYRWKIGTTGSIIILELPAFFSSADPMLLTRRLQIYCTDYLKEMNLSGWQQILERYSDNLDTSRALMQELFGEEE